MLNFLMTKLKYLLNCKIFGAENGTKKQAKNMKMLVLFSTPNFLQFRKYKLTALHTAQCNGPYNLQVIDAF